MKPSLVITAALVGVAGLWVTHTPRAVSRAVITRPAPSISSNGAFVPNVGQWPRASAFELQSSAGIAVRVDRQGWSLAPRAAGSTPPEEIRFAFTGAQTTRVRGERQLPGSHTYCLGDDPSRWRHRVPRYAAVRYERLYDGIDLQLRQQGDHPEYDLLLAPGADLTQVEVQVQGAGSLTLDDDALVLSGANGQLVQPPPRTWQVAADGTTKDVACRYVLLGRDRFGFTVEGWDETQSLVVDPELIWSSVLPGAGVAGTAYTEAKAAFAAADGTVTVVGSTRETRFPTTSGGTHAGQSDVFVSRFDPRLSGAAQLIFSVFVGGSRDERAVSLRVDDAGVVVIAGHTSSTDFPTTPGAFDRTHNGRGDIFVTRIDPAQPTSAVTFSTFLGGGGGEINTDLHLATDGVITVLGDTSSAGFPTTANAFTRTFRGGPGSLPFDNFVARLDPRLTGSAQLTYSTFFGGSDQDASDAMSVAANGIITFAGESRSTDLPTSPGAFDRTHNGNKEGFVARLDPAQSGPAQLLYGTYFGGSADDWVDAIGVNADGTITFGGDSDSDDLPTTPGSFAPTARPSNFDQYVARLDPSLSGAAQLTWSTFFGGALVEDLVALAVDPSGVVTVAGETHSADFPTTPGAYDETYNGGLPGEPEDGVLYRLDPARSGAAQLLYGTFLGGAAGTLPDGGRDLLLGLHVDDLGMATVVGYTYSDDFPTTAGAYGTRAGGGIDAFASRLSLLPEGVEVFGTTSPGCAGPLAASSYPLPSAGATIELICSNAPPTTAGLLLISAGALPAPIPVLGIDLWVDLITSPYFALPVASQGNGAARAPLVLPPASAGAVGLSLAAQFVWFGPSAPAPCPATGVSASAALRITLQP
ncbi:MAG: hypothetical protein AAF628_28855 [Planctomycetota bacterium]